MKINCKNKGSAQIPILLALLVMAFAIPLATRLVQQSADNRGKASGGTALHPWPATRFPPSTPDGKCYHDSDCGSYANCCYCSNSASGNECICGCGPTSGPTNKPPTSIPTSPPPPPSDPPTRTPTIRPPSATPTRVQPSPTPTTVQPSPTPTTVQPTPTPTSVQSAVNLEAKITFAGVNGSAQCASDWLVKTIILGSGKTEVDTDIRAVRTGTFINDLEIFKVTIPVNSLTSRTNLALFIKGPAHLQIKYAVDGQEKEYDKAGGQLCIGTNCPSVYDFTKFPILAGDVDQNGVVDGRDFSIVKTDSITRKSVEPGGYMRSDLNGNCQMESQDLTLLMLSLSYKQSQLY